MGSDIIYVVTSWDVMVWAVLCLTAEQCWLGCGELGNNRLGYDSLVMKGWTGT
jgi:hypothetical protein